jgi:methylated-DNA-protein-cysteine methyltransferase-like protein
VPAYRVVNKQALLTRKIHFDDITLMQDLLENEGVKIKGSQIIHLEKYL